ncbi:MAG: Wzt carbohydrate-binding domain-containing protein, partial [Bryobacterales bacterium]|nr:Wzt carbohydrate-binding domain-containing protein [Bryobacteraceae bacterium]MDW8130402.1 Wzt carbohydrate-binding domain-containing protein [Bryobacterales bacterium]
RGRLSWMPIEFRHVNHPPLIEFTAAAPAGALVGLVGEDSSGVRVLLRLAAGLEKPARGEILAPASRRYLGPLDALNLAPVEALLLDHALACHDALVRARAVTGLERLRRHGATVLLASHEEPLLELLSDEIWWIHEGRLAMRGHPSEVLPAWRRHVAQTLRAWGETISPHLSPSFRRGDGRAELVAIESLGADGKPTMVWASGEDVAVRVAVRFHRAVAEPVVGIMIRTRVGMEVYGTNTELERIQLGPCAAGETVLVSFHFRCDLCPGEYTITAASHDPDGVWHDWLDDAVPVTVTDVRYTAGVANLRARVTVERL